MEEGSNWTVYAIIIVVVILVIGIIVYKFYPETFSDIEKVADDVFKFGEEKKNADATQEAIVSVINSIVDCLGKSNENCGCTLDMAQLKKLPEGYQVIIQNIVDKTDVKEEKFVAVSPAKNGNPIGNIVRVNEIEISFAVPATAKEDGKGIAGIACRKNIPAIIDTQTVNGVEEKIPGRAYDNLILESQGGNIIIKEESGGTGYGPYKFYDESIVQQIYKKGDNACFITNAVEDRGSAANSYGNLDLNDISANSDDFFIYRMSNEAFTSAVRTHAPIDNTPVLGTGGREATPEEAMETTGSARTGLTVEDARKSEIANGLLSIRNCEGTAGVDYPLVWPVSIDYMTGLADCGNFETGEESDVRLQINGVQREEGFGRWIVIKAEENSNVMVPVGNGVITDFCDSNCGEKGKSVTIYGYNPTTKRVTGRVIKLSGLKTLDSKYKVKTQEIKTDGTFTGGLVVEGGETIGTSLGEIIFKEGIHRAISGSEDIIYRDFYSGTRVWTERDIERVTTSPSHLPGIMPDLPDEYYEGGGCIKIADESRAGRGSIYELADKISNMEIGALNTLLNFNINGKKYDKLVIVPTAKDIAPCTAVGCRVPYICPDGEICLCLKKGDADNYCVKLPANGFLPKFVEGSVSSGGADYKKMFYQRIGDTLGICERLPCVSNAGGMAIDSARQYAAKNANVISMLEACKREGGICTDLMDCRKPTDKIALPICPQPNEVCCIDLTTARESSAPDSKCETTYKGLCRGTSVGCTSEEKKEDNAGCPQGTQCCRNKCELEHAGACRRNECGREETSLGPIFGCPNDKLCCIASDPELSSPGGLRELGY